VSYRAWVNSRCDLFIFQASTSSSTL